MKSLLPVPLGSRRRALLAALLLAAALCGVVTTDAAAQDCGFTINSPSLTFGNMEGSTTLELTIPASCTPAVSASVGWIGAQSSGSGSTRRGILVHVEENTTGAPRTGVVRIDGQPAVSVTQGIESCVTGFTPSVVRTTADGEARTATLQTSSPDCVWAIQGFPVWASFPSPWSGRGPSSLRFGFMPNDSSTAPRTAEISYSGRTIRLEQDGASCVLSIAPSARVVGPNGGTISVPVGAAGTDCTYSAVADPGVVVASGGTGIAPATLLLTLGANTTPLPRSYTVRVRNALLTLTQQASPIVTDVSSADFAYYAPGTRPSHVTAPEEVRVTNLTTATGGWTVTATVPWVTLSATSGQAPGAFRIGIDTAAAAGLQDGYHYGTLDIRAGEAPDSPHLVQVSLGVHRVTGIQPYGAFDTPRLDSPAMSGAIPVTGWAIDDIGVSRITIWRAAAPGEAAGDVYIGDAVRVRDARPDVSGRAPEGRRAGWGYMLLSNVLPGGGNGTFTLFADVTDVEGHTTRLGPRSVTIDNAHAVEPFGTIDSPDQGEVVSGTIANRGWVLTPAGKSLPFDGSTVKVYIDGVLVDRVDRYNMPRPDVQAFFPGRANSGGPGAQLSIDTTRLADGVHTIAWGVIDDAGVPAGIGSRFFAVRNGAASQVVAPADASRPRAEVGGLSPLRSEVWARSGMDDAGWAARVQGDGAGNRFVRSPQGQRIELFLDPMLQAGCGSGYEGYLVSGGIAGPLPLGASLDAEHGIFRWQPAPEFLGVYRLVFVRHGCDGTERALSIAVVLVPAH